MRADHVLVLIAAGGLLAGCDLLAKVVYPQIGQGEQLAAADLKDPNATQFRRVGYHPGFGRGAGSVCGELNGKNSYGGYIGFKRFVVDLNKRAAALEPETDPVTEATERGHLQGLLARTDFELAWSAGHCGSAYGS